MTADREARARAVLSKAGGYASMLTDKEFVQVRTALVAMADTHRAALAEGRAQGMREAAEIAETHRALGYMSDRERDYCHQHGEECAETIRQQIASTASGGEGK